MKNTLLILLLFAAPSLRAQFPEGWDTLDQIIKLRADLKNAIRSDNRKSGASLTEELRNLSGKNHWSLMWDERWLVYHWSGRHRLLLDEVAKYRIDDRITELDVKSPPADSLFELVDQVMYQKSAGYLDVLQDLGLNPEEKMFTDIHLQYLLRNNSEEELIRRDSFIKRFTGSRYISFITYFMTLPKPVPKHYFSFDVSLMNFNWQSELERTLRPGWGGGFGLYYHRKWMVIGGKFAFSRQKTNRNLYTDFDTWAKGSASGLTKYTVEFGVNALNRSKIKVFPSVEVGWANLIAQDDPDTVDDPDVIPLSSIFNYDSGHFGFSVTADLKMFKKGDDAKATKSTLYNGIRLKLGYNWLYFGSSDNALSGNVLFFALGYQFSGR